MYFYDELNSLGSEPCCDVTCDQSRRHTVTLVPDFVMRALALHKVNVIDIQDFDQIKKVCSVDDLALWTALTNLPYKEEHGVISDNITSLFKQTLKWNEFGTIDSLSFSEETKNAAKAYAFAEDTEEPFKYELKSIGSAILVVVQPGFLAHLGKSDAVALNFFRELVKAEEQVGPLHEVAAKPIFKTILKLISYVA